MIKHTFGAYSLELDEKNPDTPAMIFGPNGGSATYDCGTATGVLDSSSEGEYDMPQPVLDWLEGFCDDVSLVFSKARAGLKEYT